MPASELRAVIFDLDGVLTDTAELHYLSWQVLADKLGIPFDRRRNEALRGLSRPESLALLLGDRAAEYSSAQKQEIADRKNADYLRRVAQMTAADLLPGSRRILEELRAADIRTAVASSSKNAVAVVKRLGIASLLDVLVDGTMVAESKPHPAGFLEAARRLSTAAAACVVVEDAASGVEGALAAGMRVIGLGPTERVGRAHRVAPSLESLHLRDFQALMGAGRPAP